MRRANRERTSARRWRPYIYIAADHGRAPARGSLLAASARRATFRRATRRDTRSPPPRPPSPTVPALLATQYGHMLRRFADEFGMAAFLLAALGTLGDVLVVRAVEPLLVRRRPAGGGGGSGGGSGGGGAGGGGGDGDTATASTLLRRLGECMTWMKRVDESGAARRRSCKTTVTTAWTTTTTSSSSSSSSETRHTTWGETHIPPAVSLRQREVPKHHQHQHHISFALLSRCMNHNRDDDARSMTRDHHGRAHITMKATIDDNIVPVSPWLAHAMPAHRATRGCARASYMRVHVRGEVKRKQHCAAPCLAVQQ